MLHMEKNYFELREYLAQKNIKFHARLSREKVFRLVTHLDISREDIMRVVKEVKNFLFSISK